MAVHIRGGIGSFNFIILIFQCLHVALHNYKVHLYDLLPNYVLLRSSKTASSIIIFMITLEYNIIFLFQELVNEIDFNYKEYARQRFQQYWLRKPELLGSSTGSGMHANSTSLIILHDLVATI